MSAAIEIHGVSKLFGTVRALDEIDLEIGPGVTGLLGPNGSGKSTLMKLVTGQLVPDTGRLRVLGRDPFADPSCMTALGLCPEHDRFYEELTGIAFVAALTRLHGHGAAEARRAAEHALARVGMTAFAGKPLRSMSRGMRQRVKIAQAIAHDPQVVLLDEPLTGTDPVSRADLIALIIALGSESRTVVVSSHVLHEVEAMTDDVVLVRHGRLRAQGNIRRLRALLVDRPYRIRMAVGDARRFAAAAIALPGVSALGLVDDATLELTTTSFELACEGLPALARSLGLVVGELVSPDADLESLYRYLVA